MLEIFANIAEILGFTLHAVDFVRDRHAGSVKGQGANDTRIVFAGLVALSSTAKSWKTLHMRYHPLSHQFQSVVREISEQREGVLFPKGVQDIAPSHLRLLFFDGFLNTAVVRFRSDTRKEIREIESSLNDKDERFAKSVNDIRVIDNSLAENFVELSLLRNDALQTHNNFLEFLSAVSGFISEPQWSDIHVRYILDHRKLLVNDLSQMINITDQVLMLFLDIYIRVVSDYAKASDIASILKRSI